MKAQNEGLGRRPRMKVADEGLMFVLYKGFAEKAP
jgi:hypothetical protein